MNTKLLGWGLLGAVALTAVLYLSGVIGPATGPVAPSEPAPETVGAPAPTPAAPEADAPPGAPLETAAVETVAQPGSDAPAPQLAPVPPRFDLVRADPDGQTLIAGSAAPGAEVTVILDGEAQPSAPADGRGRFAQFLDLPSSPEPRVLRLRMSWQGQEIESEAEVILAPPAPPPAAGEPVVVADAPPPTDAAPDAGAPAIAAAPDTESGAAPEAARETGAPAVLLSSAEGVEVLQPSAPTAPGEVAIDAITYDNAGGVTLSGRGSAESELRIYLDNRSVATARVPESGRWRAALPQVESGTYTLRVDQIDAAGEVSARAESPFLREDPERLAAASDAADPGAAPLRAVTVQPGHTLWALARDRYGEGMAYVKLFEANRDQIRDPDLIYPGQVFDMPD
ncbi:LysM peptidoglycan-binding domain-containing protein [Salipiger abyssi]|uniref:LysM peptidoglycan-binding domain-containing protein n=1 Tax=Salipiger abyssi TaxID=1250539 RepID=UPI001A8D28D1|nr:Ig-like domain-containing protein [Salipiger abyssi]MBN9887914.1 LysM peptidoglycan-binding domain-containing protein [Salipiger abyssi]